MRALALPILYCALLSVHFSLLTRVCDAKSIELLCASYTWASAVVKENLEACGREGPCCSTALNTSQVTLEQVMIDSFVKLVRLAKRRFAGDFFINFASC